jgi:hypothetical protein
LRLTITLIVESPGVRLKAAFSRRAVLAGSRASRVAAAALGVDEFCDVPLSAPRLVLLALFADKERSAFATDADAFV